MLFLVAFVDVSGRPTLKHLKPCYDPPSTLHRRHNDGRLLLLCQSSRRHRRWFGIFRWCVMCRPWVQLLTVEPSLLLLWVEWGRLMVWSSSILLRESKDVSITNIHTPRLCYDWNKIYTLRYAIIRCCGTSSVLKLARIKYSWQTRYMYKFGGILISK